MILINLPKLGYHLLKIKDNNMKMYTTPGTIDDIRVVRDPGVASGFIVLLQ